MDNGGGKKRKHFTEKTKRDIIIEQDNSCNICGQKFSKDVKPQFDHIDGKEDNSPDNCQALCANCHNNKSIEETEERAEKNRKNGNDEFGLGYENFGDIGF